jgi:uncharacterized membrane protein YkoI
VNAFFDRALEARLNGAFICGSGAPVDNGPMHALPNLPAAARRVGQRACALALVGTLVAAFAVPAWAGGEGDHERARAAVQAGDVLPLATVLERLKRSHPGQVLEVELEQEDGRWVYEIKLLQADGQLLKLELDARTAQTLEVRRKGGGKGRDERDSKAGNNERR